MEGKGKGGGVGDDMDEPGEAVTASRGGKGSTARRGGLEEEEEEEEDEGDYEQGLEGLLALASKALQDAAASSASSTPAAIAASGQWQEGAARAAADGETDSGEGGGTMGLGKRRKPPVEIDEVQPGNVAQSQV